jgi:hypothetical protein
MIKKTLLSSLLILSLVAACAEKKQLEEMHDNTVEMKDTTVKMADNMTELKGKTGAMKEITDELYDALRQGNSVQLRREAMKSILNSPTMFGKISEAGKYFMSFEMQLWNLNGQDLDADKRDVLAQQAAQEFFLEVEGLAPREGISLTPASNGESKFVKPAAADFAMSEENRNASFNALALTMQEINRKQVRILEARPETEKISMMSVMVEALRAKKALNEGADLGSKAPFIREVLVHEKKAMQILQTRYNLFPLVFVDQVSGINDKSDLGQVWQFLRGWTFDMDKLNSEQLAYLQEKVLQPALEAKNLMIELGIKPDMNYQVKGLLKGMKVVGQDKVNALVATRRMKILDLISQLIPAEPAKVAAKTEVAQPKASEKQESKILRKQDPTSAAASAAEQKPQDDTSDAKPEATTPKTSLWSKFIHSFS